MSVMRNLIDKLRSMPRSTDVSVGNTLKDQAEQQARPLPELLRNDATAKITHYARQELTIAQLKSEMLFEAAKFCPICGDRLIVLGVNVTKNCPSRHGPMFTYLDNSDDVTLMFMPSDWL